MCRMLVVVSSGRNAGRDLRRRLYDSLRRAARYDPYSMALFGEGEESHRDGWGFFAAKIGEKGVESYTVYRTLRPIFEDDVVSPYLGYEGPLVEMLHARAASTGMPVNVFSVHPVEAQSPEGHRLFLIHNGSVDKERLARAVRASGGEKSLYNDSYFLARFLASRVEDLASGSLIEEAASYTKTAMNIAAFLLSPDESLLIVGSYYKLPDKPKERRGYYKFHVGRAGNDVIYASSTIVDYYDPAPGLIEWAEIPNGGFDIYKISGGRILHKGRIVIGGVG